MTTFNAVLNWATSSLALAMTAGSTSLTVASGEGTLFGTDFPMVLVIDYNLPSYREIVLATGRVGDVIQVTRAQEGTTATTHAASAIVRNNLTAGQMEDVHDAINALEGGAVVAHAAQHEEGGTDEIDLSGLSGEEITLTPKTSSTGAEGTIFYSSIDDHVYVGTE